MKSGPKEEATNVIKDDFLDDILDDWHHFTMTRITGKYQITLPKRLVDAFGIKVGDEVELIATGDTISIVPAHAVKPLLTLAERLQHFDQATQRQRARERKQPVRAAKSRGWTREELYTRGRAR